MTGPDDGPYEVVFANVVVDEVRALPFEAREALRAALEVVAADPWAGMRYHPRHPEEMRSATYGGWGVLVYVVREKGRQVIVAHVSWAG